jgi:hypothetical protein
MNGKPWRERFFRKFAINSNRDTLMKCKKTIENSLDQCSWDEFDKAYEELKTLATHDLEAKRLVKQYYQKLCQASARILPEGYVHNTISEAVFKRYIANQLNNKQELSPNN